MLMLPAMSLMVALLALTRLAWAGPEPPSVGRFSILSFVRDLASDKGDVRKISFNPEAGARFREQYERKYGPRGSLLIERFGQGLGTEDAISPLVDIDQVLEPSKNKTRHYRTYDFNPPKTKAKKEEQHKDEEVVGDLSVN